MNVDRSRFLLLTAALAAAACNSLDAQTAEPPPSLAPSAALAPIEVEGEGHDRDAGPRIEVALPLRGAVSFAARRADSCSQSWAVSSRTGQAVVAADARGRATLTLRWDGEEIGGGWGENSTTYRHSDSCELAGRARIEANEVVLEFEFPRRDKKNWPPYECQPVARADEVRSFEMRCVVTALDLGVDPDAAPSRREPVFGCRFGDAAPYLVGELIDDRRVLEFADERLHVSAVHDGMDGLDRRERWFEAGSR